MCLLGEHVNTLLTLDFKLRMYYGFIERGLNMPKLAQLKRLREQRFLTQKDLAEKARVSIGTVQRIEAGEDARPSTIRKLAGALLVELEDLAGGEE